MITDPNRLLAGFVPPEKEWRPEFIVTLDEMTASFEDRANNETQEDLDGSLGGSQRHPKLLKHEPNQKRRNT
jgi:hypothetical protein